MPNKQERINPTNKEKKKKKKRKKERKRKKINDVTHGRGKANCDLNLILVPLEEKNKIK